MNLRWDYYLGATYFPLRYGHLVISQGHTGGDMAIDVTTHKLAWSVAWVRPGAAHCLIQGARGKTLLLEMLEDAVALAGIEPATGKIAWKSMMLVGNYHDGLAAGSGRFAYVPGGHQYPPKGKGARGGFYCFDGATGKVIWSYERPDILGQCMIVSEGCVYGLADHSIYKFVPIRQSHPRRKANRARA
ncbi:MAG TPA: PQQ-binding-like beta-propeller repeat protein [Chthonomonadaceae bacterium]|nr:PQQ-binding-like beta-propeller repeat protein [Chthonomonadaceae bacterium]